jgi:hypothetical protein
VETKKKKKKKIFLVLENQVIEKKPSLERSQPLSNMNYNMIKLGSAS